MNQNNYLMIIKAIKKKQEATSQAHLRDDTVLIMLDFNDKEIEWEHLHSHGERELWIYKFMCSGKFPVSPCY